MQEYLGVKTAIACGDEMYESVNFKVDLPTVCFYFTRTFKNHLVLALVG